MWISACRIVGGSRKRKVIKFEKNLGKMFVKGRNNKERVTGKAKKKTKKNKKKPKKSQKKGKRTKIHNLR